MAIGQRLKYQDGGKSLCWIEKPDDLRPHPIGMNVDRDKAWDYLQDCFYGIDEVWQEIKSGEDLNRDSKNRQAAKDLLAIYGDRIKLIKTYRQSVELGAEMERYMFKQYGVRFMATGGHGSSNSALMGSFGGVKGAFNILTNAAMIVSKDTPGVKTCPVCGEPYLGSTCGVCGYKEPA